ncbi:ferritin-like domain-containing protein [Roseateles cellulosilyticus]|uniref:CDGSH iron-sulfur domain-containing protein n=1 Tax=Pelomonas cellulosilytica TaxID=2906762 RepID=A0ABS8XWT7_9BURK|nr:ferritin-like domain-containing protein [Pelomonas sp. P8]MCE4555760.1 CDGSH iron-sulfur domain-containing protein [Pelomonas sp. P8]
MTLPPTAAAPSREQLLHNLYEAAELEHNLMCTYLYAAFSLRQGEAEGLTAAEAEAIERWRREIIAVAVEEMGHLVAVWNITAALGGAPRIGRGNFPLDPGYLPARVIVKLAPFSDATLQHFIYLERPEGSQEHDGEGFDVERLFVRQSPVERLTPMPRDYDTVGHFYATLSEDLQAFVAEHGEAASFCGARGLQLGPSELTLGGARPVLCAKTALAAFDAIVAQGEGAPSHTQSSHYQRFAAIRTELAALSAANPSFRPAWPAATNPVLRRPPRPEGRIWLEDPAAATTVDIANASYGLMLRLLAQSYALTGPSAEKSLHVDLAVALMRAVTPLAEHAARLPAGPSHPGCHAGMSFTTLRDAAALPPGPAARRFVRERLGELADAAARLHADQGAERTGRAAQLLQALRERADRGLDLDAPAALAPAPAPSTAPASPAPPSEMHGGIEVVQGDKLELRYEARRCIHARFCVTGAPKVFLANVKGAWLYPDAMPVERLVDIAHACPSGAIQYRRKDGEPDEAPPPVNLLSVRESGPNALRGELYLRGEPLGTRATLCRCGASRNKPFCDGSHHDIHFAATGEPETGLLDLPTDMPAERAGRIDIEPEPNGPLQLRGQVEVVSGTGRMVCRVAQARLCRCGGSATKPFCDGTHARNGFTAD